MSSDETGRDVGGRVLVSLAAFVVIVAGMKAASALIVPFLIATFLALITVRPMLWLQARHVPTVLAALLIVLTIMAALTVLGVVVGRSLAAFTVALPGYQQQLQGLFEGAVRFVAQYTDSDQSVERISDLINPGWAMGLAATLLNAVRDIMTNTLLIVFTMIFILLEASTAKTKFEAAFGTSADSLENVRDFMQNLGRYLGIKTLVSLATGLCAGVLTWSLGLDFPLLWAMLAFLLNYVPNIGSIIAAVPAVLLAMVSLDLTGVLLVVAGYVGVNTVFGNVLEPRMMGRGLGLSTLVVFLSLLFWGWVLGPVGMLLSGPLTMMLKLALETDPRTRRFAALLGPGRPENGEEADARPAEQKPSA